MDIDKLNEWLVNATLIISGFFLGLLFGWYLITLALGITIIMSGKLSAGIVSALILFTFAFAAKLQIDSSIKK